MDTQFQDLDWVIEYSSKRLQKNKNSRISSIFREIRKKYRYSLLGDYSILWAIAKSMDILGIPRIRRQFYVAARQSKEFMELRNRDKSMWLDNFVGVL